MAFQRITKTAPAEAWGLQKMETEDQKKDRERLDRYIVREQLVSHMNNTKWDKLRELMVELGNESLLYRVQCLRERPAHGWDGDWYYHLPTYKSIEWLSTQKIELR